MHDKTTLWLKGSNFFSGKKKWDTGEYERVRKNNGGGSESGEKIKGIKLLSFIRKYFFEIYFEIY